MKRTLTSIAIILVGCAPGDPARRNTLASGRSIEVLRSAITGAGEERYLSLAYISDTPVGEALLSEIRDVWNSVRPEAEESGVRSVYIRADARYPHVQVYMVGWELPAPALLPSERASVWFSRLGTGEWSEGDLGCSTMGWCELRGGTADLPPVHWIAPSRWEFLAVLLAGTLAAWLTAAGMARLLCRIEDRVRRWLYGGTLAALAGTCLSVLPAFPLVWLVRQNGSGAFVCSFSGWVSLGFLSLTALYGVRLATLMYGRRTSG